MRPVKPGIEPIELFGKNHQIPTIGLRNEGNPIHMNKIPRSRQRDPHTITGVGAVSDEVLTFHLGHTWILYAELFIGGKGTASLGNQKRLGMGREIESVRTACQANDGSSSAQMGSE